MKGKKILLSAMVLFSVGTVALSPFIAEKILSADTDRKTVCIKDGERQSEMPEKEFILSVLAAVCPEDYPAQALSALSVVIATAGARGDFTCSSEEGILFSSPERLPEDTLRRFSAAAEEAAAERIIYGGELILPAFHESSPGATVSYFDIFGESENGEEYPYLVSVPSDKTEEKIFIPDEALESSLGETALSVSEFSKSGGVIIPKTLLSGDREVSAPDFRALFSIPSPFFTLSEAPGGIEVTVLGRGHGVGFSVSGAAEKANAGASCSDIIFAYFPGCEILKFVE